jgi:hypothetical protein
MGMRLWTKQKFLGGILDFKMEEDKERDGRPKSTWTAVNIAAFVDLIINDHWIASRMITESLNIPKTVVLRILKEDLGKRKLCAHFLPHSLTPEQREDQVTSFQDIIAMADADKIFLNKIITGNETWCFFYDPETKRQNSEWVGETSPRPKKLKFQRSHVKTMLILLLRLSRRSAHRNHTRGKNSKCRIL